MKRFLALCALTALLLCHPHSAGAQMSVNTGLTCPSTAIVPVGNNRPLYGMQDGGLCTHGTFSATISGNTSNASSGVATSSTNNPSVSYNYGFNGTTWDQLQVDASKYLKINCIVGCAGGSTSNASSGVATSSTNGASVAYNYGFNGTTWDQLQVDGSKNLKVTLGSTNSNVVGPTPDGTAASTPPVLIGGTADGTPTGAVEVAKVDANGNVANNPASATPVTTSALAANQIVKTSAGTLYSFQVAADATLSGAAWWVMIYNATSAPTAGAVTPTKCYPIPSGTTTVGGVFNSGGVAFSTGIVIGVSTTGCFTKTASTHAFISGDFQ